MEAFDQVISYYSENIIKGVALVTKWQRDCAVR